MVLTIFDNYGLQRATVSPNGSSTQQKEVQGDNVLSLSFTHYEHIVLDVNDYADFMGERYWLTDRYTPVQKSEGEWVYDIKMYGIESLIKRFLVLETTDGNAEPVFTLTAHPREHVAMVVKCINEGMGTTSWKVGQVDGRDNIVIDYEGKFCDEALKDIAKAVGGQAEWWVEGQTVNVCRCEHGEQITLGYGNGLKSLERAVGNTGKFYTRLFPIGSSRNIDPDRYGHSRLMLPGGRKFVEIHTDEYGIHDRYEKDAFSGIYPRRLGVVSSVRSEDVTDENGANFKIYYFTDQTQNFSPNDYELPGETKRVSFQNGEMAGLGQGNDHYFEVNYNDETEEFEIITIWPYDDNTQLPGGSLVPRPGDNYILWNIRMPDEYYALAEEEFLSAVEQYNRESWQDASVYKAPTDHVWVEDNEANLFVGRRVRLESSRFFPGMGYRDSRITKITRSVELPGQMDIEISDALQTGAMDRVNDSIGELKNYTRSQSASGALPDIIRSWEDTLPTDTNLFSARKSMKEFINKNKPDHAKELITFDKGIQLGSYQEGDKGGRLDENGVGELMAMIIREWMRSPRFVNGFAGEGWKLWLDENGLANLELDKLSVRRTMRIFELLIQKIRSVGGMICVSAANGKIKAVEDNGDYYHITFEQDNMFLDYDLMRCQTFTGNVLKGYWVEIAHGDQNGVDVLKTEFEGSEPEAGDECVLMGNTQLRNRQNLILISATDDGLPRIDVLDGVCGKSFAGALRARFGCLDGINDSAFPIDKQPHGSGVYSDNAYLRGTFILSTGEDIKTKFEVMEGKISSSITSVRDDFLQDKGYLSNPTFADGLTHWTAENETVFFLIGNRWIWANNNVLSKKGNGASVVNDGGRKVVNIKNKYIKQTFANLRGLPEIRVVEGKKQATPVYLSFFYKVKKAGTLDICFENVDNTGFDDYEAFSISQQLAVTDGYTQFYASGLWNATGDFKLSFTGEINLYMLVLSTDKIEVLTHTYRTLFEQSDRLVKFAAQNIAADGTILEDSYIITTAKYNELMSERFDENGVLINKSGLVTTADFNELMSARFDENGKLINTSGLVTTAEFSTLFANAVSENGIVTSAEMSVAIESFVDENGVKTLISNAKIKADKIDFEGSTTFASSAATKLGLGNLAYLSSLSASNITGLGSLATKDGVSADDVSGLGALAKLNSVAADNVTGLGSLAKLNSVSYSNLVQALKNLIDGKANSSGLGDLAYLSKVGLAMLNDTVIDGGFIKTSLIDVDSLYVSHLNIKSTTVEGVMETGMIYGRHKTNSHNYVTINMGGAPYIDLIQYHTESKGPRAKLAAESSQAFLDLYANRQNISSGSGLSIKAHTSGMQFDMYGLPTSKPSISGRLYVKTSNNEKYIMIS